MANLYVLGDSHTQALGPRIKTRFPGHNVRFEAFPGYSTDRAQGAANIPLGMDAVVLSLGGNDRGDKSGARANLVSAVRTRNPRAKIVWFGPFDAHLHEWAGSVHDEQAESQRRQLPLLGVTWIDTRPFSRTGHRADNVHFTASGYTAIADRMKAPIAAALTGGGMFQEPSTGGGVLVTLVAAGAALWWILRD